MLEKKVMKNSSEYENVKELLHASFPADEIVPMWYLLLLVKKGRADFTAYYDEGVFVGFTHVIEIERMAYLLYFAVDGNIRSKGYGSKILSILKKKYKGKPITLNSETVDASADNYEQRAKRQAFYNKNGFKNTGLYVKVLKSYFDVLSFGRFNRMDFIRINKRLSFGIYRPILRVHRARKF